MISVKNGLPSSSNTYFEQQKEKLLLAKPQKDEQQATRKGRKADDLIQEKRVAPNIGSLVTYSSFCFMPQQLVLVCACVFGGGGEREETNTLTVLSPAEL